MSHAGGYCPNCEQYVSPPLLPLDYYQCNNCMMTIHADDLVRKRSMAMGGGGVPRSFDMGLIGYAVLYDGAQVADTVNVSCNYNSNDWLFVVVSTCGANQFPSTVTAAGTSLVQLVTAGSQSHSRTSIYYGRAQAGGNSLSVFWTGQHPNAAVVSVLRTSTAAASPILNSGGNAGNASSTSATLGTNQSPTASNAYCIYAVGVEAGQGTISNVPSGYTLSNLQSTGSAQNPVDTEQAVFVKDLTNSATVGSVTNLSGTNYYSQVMVIVGKS